MFYIELKIKIKKERNDMPKRFVMTGAMGSGKSTILKLLQSAGLSVIEEPARQILAEQRSIGDDGVPEKNPKYFSQLMLSRAIYQFKQTQELDGNVIHNRGIPDMIAYFDLFNLSYPPAEQASQLFRYEPSVFIFPAWQEIYATDDERKMSFELAQDFGSKVQKIYSEYGYTLINVPCISPEERAQFIIERLN
jgi:predicted ATPase